jgi:hypothetical protein
VLLKKTNITPFKELFWKIKIQQRKEMLSINNRIPRIKKSGHLLPVLPLIPQKTTKMEEEKGRFIAFDLKTRVGPGLGSKSFWVLFPVVTDSKNWKILLF